MIGKFWRQPQPNQHAGLKPPTSNYRPYELFTLRTKLYPFVHKMLGYNKEILFSSDKQGELRELKLRIYDADEEMTLSDEMKNLLQEKIDYILSNTPSDYALIFFFFHHPQLMSLPVGWVKSILKYIDLEDRAEPYVNEDGIFAKVVHQPDEFVKDVILSPTATAKWYTNIIERQLLSWFYTGAIVQPPMPVVDDWMLEQSSYDQQFYIANYNQLVASYLTQTYGSVTNFLLEITKCSPCRIYHNLGLNYAKRHLVSVFLNAVGIQHMYQGVLLILPYLTLAEYTLLVYHFERLFEDNEIQVIAHDHNPNEGVTTEVSYQLGNLQTIVSSRIGFRDNVEDYINAYETNSVETPLLLPDEKNINIPTTNNVLLIERDEPQLHNLSSMFLKNDKLVKLLI